MRVNQPAGWFYTSDALRTLADIWERHGSSLTNMHGSTGDIILLGTRSDELEPAFKELTEAGFDLGGSGSAMRTPSACVGPARCEWACYDTLPERLRGIDCTRGPVGHRHLERRHPPGRRGGREVRRERRGRPEGRLRPLPDEGDVVGRPPTDD
jgi:hypothetical protein